MECFHLSEIKYLIMSPEMAKIIPALMSIELPETEPDTGSLAGVGEALTGRVNDRVGVKVGVGVSVIVVVNLGVSVGVVPPVSCGLGLVDSLIVGVAVAPLAPLAAIVEVFILLQSKRSTTILAEFLSEIFESVDLPASQAKVRLALPDSGTSKISFPKTPRPGLAVVPGSIAPPTYTLFSEIFFKNLGKNFSSALGSTTSTRCNLVELNITTASATVGDSPSVSIFILTSTLCPGSAVLFSGSNLKKAA